MKGFEFIEHTADVGIRVFGASKEELFSNVALALFALLVEHKPKPTITREVILKAERLDDLLITWLNELISLFFAEKFLPAKFSLSIQENKAQKKLKAVFWGDEYDPYKNKIKMEIKAATYHNLKIEKTDEGYVAEVIFDV